MFKTRKTKKWSNQRLKKTCFFLKIINLIYSLSLPPNPNISCPPPSYELRDLRAQSLAYASKPILRRKHQFLHDHRKRLRTQLLATDPGFPAKNQNRWGIHEAGVPGKKTHFSGNLRFFQGERQADRRTKDEAQGLSREIQRGFFWKFPDFCENNLNRSAKTSGNSMGFMRRIRRILRVRTKKAIKRIKCKDVLVLYKEKTRRLNLMVLENSLKNMKNTIPLSKSSRKLLEARLANMEKNNKNR